jgi:hypothetical protein
MEFGYFTNVPGTIAAVYWNVEKMRILYDGIPVWVYEKTWSRSKLKIAGFVLFLTPRNFDI